MDNCVGQWWEALGPKLPGNNLEKKKTSVRFLAKDKK